MKIPISPTLLARIIGGIMIVSGVIGFAIEDLVIGVRMNVIRNLLHTFIGIAGASVDTDKEARLFFLVSGIALLIATVAGYIVVAQGNLPYAYHVYQWENHLHGVLAAFFFATHVFTKKRGT